MVDRVNKTDGSISGTSDSVRELDTLYDISQILATGTNQRQTLAEVAQRRGGAEFQQLGVEGLARFAREPAGDQPGRGVVQAGSEEVTAHVHRPRPREPQVRAECRASQSLQALAAARADLELDLGREAGQAEQAAGLREQQGHERRGDALGDRRSLPRLPRIRRRASTERDQGPHPHRRAGQAAHSAQGARWTGS